MKAPVSHTKRALQSNSMEGSEGPESLYASTIHKKSLWRLAHQFECSYIKALGCNINGSLAYGILGSSFIPPKYFVSLTSRKNGGQTNSGKPINKRCWKTARKWEGRMFYVNEQRTLEIAAHAKTNYGHGCSCFINIQEWNYVRATFLQAGRMV
jgi:hypothetical protein